MSRVLILLFIFTQQSILLSNVNIRLLLISNEAENATRGNIVVELEAISDAGDVYIEQFRSAFTDSEELYNLNPTMTISNKLFNVADYEIKAEDLTLKNNNPNIFIVHYDRYTSGTAKLISGSTWTRIYTMTIGYDLTEGETVTFNWKGDFAVDDLAWNSLEGNEGDLPSNVSLNPSTPLPVELTTFNAEVNEDIVSLYWKTDTEINNYGFEIERKKEEASISDKINTSEWELIGFVSGHGNSNSPKFYSFQDQSFQQYGAYQYRLKQIDLDGKSEYSDIVNVQIFSQNEFELHQNYPNPFNPNTQVKFTIPEISNVKIHIYNSLGELVTNISEKQYEAGSYSFTWNAGKLVSGVYFIKIEAKSILSNFHFTGIKKAILAK